MSIGVAVAGDHARGADAMLREADLALYAAKSAGKTTIRLYEPALQKTVVERALLRSALENAISNEQLRVYYQPILQLSTRDVVGLEALVRWQHPTKGLVSPDDFIPIAEQTGLIVPLGECVLNQACAALARWQWARTDSGGTPLKMHVNVSPLQIRSRRFLDVVDRVLAEYAVDPSTLVLEITESCLAENHPEVAACLSGLHERGIPIALDDFGTGYSSLSYLHRFPVGALKVDRSFVSAMDTTEGLNLVKAILAMAGSLGLSVVAEGIEKVDEAAALVELGCLEGQGFLYWRPMPFCDANTLLGQPAPPLVTA